MEKFVFVHIHKTGGMSLYSALEDFFGPESCIRFANGGLADSAAFESLNTEALKNIRLISGHFFYPTFLRKITPDWTPIVIVRNPLERIFSAYNYMSQPFHALAEAVGGMSFEEYYEHISSGARGENNIQCQYICGEPSFELALSKMKDCGFVFSSLDNMQSLFHEMSSRIGVDLPCREINASTKRQAIDTISPALKHKILLENQEDYKLFFLLNALSSFRVNRFF